MAKRKDKKPLIALIVEDDQDSARLYTKVLKTFEFDYDIVHTSYEGMEHLDKHTPDLILLDLNLEAMSGEDILKKVRADKRLTKTSIIVITSYATKSKSLAPEPDYVLIKPVRLQELHQLIETIT